MSALRNKAYLTAKKALPSAYFMRDAEFGWDVFAMESFCLVSSLTYHLFVWVDIANFSTIETVQIVKRMKWHR